MPDAPTPEDLGTYLKEIERRVRVLETAPRAIDTTLPIAFEILTATFTTSSLTEIDSTPAGPTATINVGQSGRAIVTASAFIGLDAASMTATAVLYVDGVRNTSIVGLSSSASLIAGNVSSSRVVSLTPGAHTFVLKYYVTAGTGNFSARSLIVQTF